MAVVCMVGRVNLVPSKILHHNDHGMNHCTGCKVSLQGVHFSLFNVWFVSLYGKLVLGLRQVESTELLSIKGLSDQMFAVRRIFK